MNSPHLPEPGPDREALIELIGEKLRRTALNNADPMSRSLADAIAALYAPVLAELRRAGEHLRAFAIDHPESATPETWAILHTIAALSGESRS